MSWLSGRRWAVAERAPRRFAMTATRAEFLRILADAVGGQVMEAFDPTEVPKRITPIRTQRMSMGSGIIPVAAPAPVATPLPPFPRRKIE